MTERLGVTLRGEGLRDLLGLALRRNPKRAHLLVSTVLGKHVPQLPSAVYGAGTGLGRRVRALLGDVDADRAVVLGFAETATGLGHSVADGIGAVPYLHSTRRRVPGVAPVGGFEEEHSHATSHLLLPEDPELLRGDGPLVLVDDEFSTGRTARNTIAALHAIRPRDRYVIAGLVDMRSPEDTAALEKCAAELGARVDVLALASGGVRLPDDVLERGRELVAAHGGDTGTARGTGDRAPVRRVDLGWPGGLPDGGRHGFGPRDKERLDAALPGMAERVLAGLDLDADGDGDASQGRGYDYGPGQDSATGLGQASAPGGAPAPDRVPATGPGGGATPAARVLVLGSEELMYAPLRLADELERHTRGAAEIRFSTTTRSPVLAVDDPGYAIRSALRFPAHDAPYVPCPAPREGAGTAERYAYNVAGQGFDAVVAVVDSEGDTGELHAPGGLLDQLSRCAPRVLLAVVPAYVPACVSADVPASYVPADAPARTATGLPRPLGGPAFSSYAAEDVAWLLQDLSDVELEAPTEEREEAIQAGGAHYAESLPVEFQPSAEYQRLFHTALQGSAARIARAVGTVTETVLAERGPRPVLASLARAGTPVGVLMRRWARYAHGLDLPHYAVSIVRGRGIDTTALRYLAAHHDPADVVFVDGWTGKGAITRELADALAGSPGFEPELAVLADPGSCVRTYGTREDFLIPSACLNSTVSGLISRTVLRADLVGPDDFHGAKFYRELAGDDVSGLFLEAVEAQFDAVRDAVTRDAAVLAGADRAPTWEGWHAVERISEEYGIGNVNLVKPGVGETTRVLLRRVPWRILARRGAGADLDHVRLLAEQRGVPVEETDDLPYTCVGLIHPRYTRGATGADGKAAR
ncbi:phosphoribosyltransferase [Streptomyces iconiensis]|uniref:Phosphoribosyltransferase n=1 Tax=Streptomyces iconiensis TaxID=1384038 RepID=A0ABT6ZNM5_9ACTN|nr:phosphoribosyltransferase [Streptomyces iconiensis]MDJ1130643.1 phosphoribosyltransferase [Streptomyces iconiensis]